jgi:hypothetical protein
MESERKPDKANHEGEQSLGVRSILLALHMKIINDSFRDNAKNIDLPPIAGFLVLIDRYYRGQLF